MLIHGAAGGVGQFATQLARWRGAYVIGTASGGAAVEDVLALGGNEIIDRAAVPFEKAVSPVDLVFDTVGGETLARSAAVLRERGRLVSVTEEPRAAPSEVEATFFVVEPSREQLIQLAGWSMRTSSEPSSTPPSLSLTPRRRSSESWAPASAARSSSRSTIPRQPQPTRSTSQVLGGSRTASEDNSPSQRQAYPRREGWTCLQTGEAADPACWVRFPHAPLGLLRGARGRTGLGFHSALESEASAWLDRPKPARCDTRKIGT